MLKMPYRLSAFWHTTSVNQNMSSVRLFVFHPQTECLFHLNPCMVAVTFTVLQQNWLDFFFFPSLHLLGRRLILASDLRTYA